MDRLSIGNARTIVLLRIDRARTGLERDSAPANAGDTSRSVAYGGDGGVAHSPCTRLSSARDRWGRACPAGQYSPEHSRRAGFRFLKLSPWPACFAAFMICSSTALTAAETVTFNKQIAPIIYKNCASCHRPGEAAPFP